ncbi:class I SAM-dependent methyltransferase [Methylomarinovum caldicuralii]|uniref:class I SAM-dependent methyltransferase n=1 Tax=Methylomarinovum caldicuralii TaxID=438856 RepID=UPI002954E424|nr:class I SAM-dependent methyltransferase [Methylomarinovum caldicuralii]
MAGLESFYDGNFSGDAGAPSLAAAEGRPSARKVRAEEKRVRRWSLPLLQRYLDLQGKSVLDLRMRSGALAQAMTAAGAQVLGTDPFPANVRYAAEARGLPFTRRLKITETHLFPGFDPQRFDLITGLTVHVLGHLLSPRQFLHQAYEILKPGGWLFLMEKDVLQPNYNVARPTPFSSGVAHQFHLTRDTLERYLKATGFEIVHCAIDPLYATGQNRVIVAIARRPDTPPPPFDLASLDHDLDASLSRVRRIETWWRWYAFRGRMWKRLTRWQRKLLWRG